MAVCDHVRHKRVQWLGGGRDHANLWSMRFTRYILYIYIYIVVILCVCVVVIGAGGQVDERACAVAATRRESGGERASMPTRH